jgi:cyclase
VSTIRLIAILDIKGENLIKGIHLEGLRVLGKPNSFALDYYEQGIDELIFMDCVASLYGRNQLNSIITEAASNIFVPITVGGGIRSVDDVANILRSGADKVAVNTAAIKNPKLITDITQKYGKQCLVLSIEAKEVGKNQWEAYTDNGREKTGLNVLDWAVKATQLGAGEILITSIDKEGTKKGFDINLISAVTSRVSVPVIASGGMGKPSDLVDVVKQGNADAIAMASVLHYKQFSLEQIRLAAQKENLDIRAYE